MKRNLKYIFLIIILILILIISFFYKKMDQEGFLDTNYEKTIYLVWRNKHENTETNYGFGDKLRGSIFLYQYCKENRINLKIDATDDICSEFLKNVISPDYDVIKTKSLTLLNHWMSKEEIDKKIKFELSYNNTIYVFSNFFPNENFAPDDVEFAKYISEPTKLLTLEINEKLNNLPKNFGIKHFRFDDKVFKKDVDSNDKLFNHFYGILKENYKPTDILLTNSTNFKKYVKQQIGIQTIDCNNALCKIQHIGVSLDIESVKNSFIEFFIISKSSYLQSYSSYNWPSNFVKWPCKIYQIPFQNLYIDENKL